MGNKMNWMPSDVGHDVGLDVGHDEVVGCIVVRITSNKSVNCTTC